MLGDLGLAFSAGLISCASACVLPLLPAYVAYLGGLSPDANRSAARSRLPVLGNALLFVAGFGTAFVALGTGAGMVGEGLAAYRPVFSIVAGMLLVVFGLALLGGIPWLRRERRFHPAHRLPRAPWASYVVGVAFAVGWTPCVGPILAAVLVQAASSATAVRGAVLLAAYSAGLGLPFVAAALFLGPVMALVRRARGVYPVLNAAAAIVLIGVGVLTLSDRLTVLNGYVPNLALPQPAARLSATEPPQSPSRLLGRRAPAVTVGRLGGGRTSLAALRGHPVVVTFWATWCEPCRQELPLFSAEYGARQDQGLVLVAVNEQESGDAVGRFWAGLGLEPVPYLDPDGSAASAFGVGLQRTGLPVTVLVGRDGNVAAVLPGQVDAADLKARLDNLLRS